jgi:hypothetical protein
MQATEKQKEYMKMYYAKTKEKRKDIMRKYSQDTVEIRKPLTQITKKSIS